MKQWQSFWLYTLVMVLTIVYVRSESVVTTVVPATNSELQVNEYEEFGQIQHITQLQIEFAESVHLLDDSIQFITLRSVNGDHLNLLNYVFEGQVAYLVYDMSQYTNSSATVVLFVDHRIRYSNSTIAGTESIAVYSIGQQTVEKPCVVSLNEVQHLEAPTGPKLFIVELSESLYSIQATVMLESDLEPIRIILPTTISSMETGEIYTIQPLNILVTVPPVTVSVPILNSETITGYTEVSLSGIGEIPSEFETNIVETSEDELRVWRQYAEFSPEIEMQCEYDCSTDLSMLEHQVFNFYNVSDTEASLLVSIEYFIVNGTSVFKQTKHPMLGYTCSSCTKRAYNMNNNCPYCDWSIHKLNPVQMIQATVQSNTQSVTPAGECIAHLNDTQIECTLTEQKVEHLFTAYEVFEQILFSPVEASTSTAQWILSDNYGLTCGSPTVAPEYFIFQKDKCQQEFNSCTRPNASLPHAVDLVFGEITTDSVFLKYKTFATTHISIPLDYVVIESSKPSVDISLVGGMEYDSTATEATFVLQLTNNGSVTQELNYFDSNCSFPLLHVSTDITNFTIPSFGVVFISFVARIMRPEVGVLAPEISAYCEVEFYVERMSVPSQVSLSKIIQFSLYYGRFVAPCLLTFEQPRLRINNPLNPVALYSSGGVFNLTVSYVAGYFVTGIDLENIGDRAGQLNTTLTCNGTLHQESILRYGMKNIVTRVKSSVRRYSEIGQLFCLWNVQMVVPEDECWESTQYVDWFTIDFKTHANETIKGIRLQYSSPQSPWYYVMLSQVYGDRPEGVLIIALIVSVIVAGFFMLICVTFWRHLLVSDFLLEHCV